MRTVLTTLALLLSSALLAQETPQQLVGYYPFEETTGAAVLDASGLGHHGEIMNDSRGVKRVTGRNGGALEFTGGDPTQRNQAGCLALRGLEGVDFTKGLTVEAWVKLSQFTREETYELISNTQSDRGKGFRFALFYQSLCLRSGEGDAGKTWGGQTNPSEFAANTDQWYHLAGTYDGSVYRVYVDGVLMGMSEPNLALTPGQPQVFIGAYAGGYAYGLNGVVDDVRLYNYARPDAEIVLDAKLRN
jgi:large repetitive protein